MRRFCSLRPTPSGARLIEDVEHAAAGRSKTRDGYLAWLKEWVLDIADHAAYRAKLGATLDALRIKGEALAADVNYAAE